MSYGGFWRRLAAFLIDTIPITILITMIFVIFGDFGELWNNRWNNPYDLEARRRFIVQRNTIRSASLLIFLGYSVLAEASALRGTFGKRMMGLRVVNHEGGQLTLWQSMMRTGGKVLSSLPCSLGYIWAAFDPQKRTWHDLIAKTYVVTDKVAASDPSTMSPLRYNRKP